MIRAPKYKVERNIYGHAKAISKDGYYILQLVEGTTRNEENVEEIVEALNTITKRKNNHEKKNNQ
jgi:hypothetical protein